MRTAAISLLCIFGTASICVSSAEEVSMKAEKAMVITFPSQTQRTYRLLGTENAAGNWTTLQDGIVGTGGEVTVFYKSESDQKLFFKVETSEGGAAQESLLGVARLDLTEQDLTGYQLANADLRRFVFVGANLSQANLSGASLNFAQMDGANFDGANLQGANLSDASYMQASFRGADLRQVTLKPPVNLTGVDLSGANLSGLVLTGANLSFARLDHANVAGLDIQGASGEETTFRGVDMRQVKLQNAAFHRAQFEETNFEGKAINNVDFFQSDFRNANFNGATFSKANLRGATGWSGAQIHGTRFIESSLQVDFSGRDLSSNIFLASLIANSSLSGANLAGAKVSRCALNAILDGAILTNVDFEGTFFSQVNASGQDLTGSLLRGVTFSGSDWSNLHAPGVDASFATWFNNSDFLAANFSGANLEGAWLKEVQMMDADLRNTRLRDADLRGANLQNADLTGADLSFAQIAGANLSGVTGLNPEQPGLDFGGGTVLPDGTTRSGKNAGTGFAPSAIPASVRFEINNLGVMQTRVLTFSGGLYSEAGHTGGAFEYRSFGNVAEVLLPGQFNHYTLQFTTSTRGTLFRNVRNGTAALYIVGTFSLPE